MFPNSLEVSRDKTQKKNSGISLENDCIVIFIVEHNFSKVSKPPHSSQRGHELPDHSIVFIIVSINAI